MVLGRLRMGVFATAVVWSLTAGGALAPNNPQDSSKKKADMGPFGLPTPAVLKEKLTLKADQVSKIEGIYSEAAAKETELNKAFKEAPDKKKAAAEVTAARSDTIARIKLALTDEQKKTFDELVPSATAKGSAPTDDMTPYRTLADDTLKAFKAGDMDTAKKKARELEVAWDTSGKRTLGDSRADEWKTIDKAMDAFIKPLMKKGASPDAAKVQTTYDDFIAKLNKAAKP